MPCILTKEIGLTDAPEKEGRMAHRARSHHPRRLSALAWLAAALCILPMAAVGVAALGGGARHAAQPRGLRPAALRGHHRAAGRDRRHRHRRDRHSTAWLVTATRFPGRRILEIALALPLTYPAYVLAYAYTDFLDHPGWVQSTLRDLTGWGPRDYWFPEIRSLGRRRGHADPRPLSLRLPARPRGLSPAILHRLYRRAHAGAGAMGRLLPRLPSPSPALPSRAACCLP